MDNLGTIVLIGFVLWIILSFVLPSSKRKGWLGEKKTTFNIWLSLDAEVYRRFHDVIIPAANGTTQIDHLLVSPYGLFIVETKNIKGWIFGSEDQAKWTKSVFGKKYSFQNPLRQTFRQKKILSEFLGLDEPSIHTVIFFVGDCKFKTKLPSNVIKSGLGKYIKQFQTQVLSPNEINQISGKLAGKGSEVLEINSHVPPTPFLARFSRAWAYRQSIATHYLPTESHTRTMAYQHHEIRSDSSRSIQSANHAVRYGIVFPY